MKPSVAGVMALSSIAALHHADMPTDEAMGALVSETTRLVTGYLRR